MDPLQKLQDELKAAEAKAGQAQAAAEAAKAASDSAAAAEASATADVQKKAQAICDHYRDSYGLTVAN